MIATQLIKELKKTKDTLISTGALRAVKEKEFPEEKPPFELPPNWVWARLRDISIIQEGPGIRKHQYTEDGIQFLTVTNILEGSVDLKKSQKYISVEEYESKYKHFELNKNDIVLACSGGSWGKSAIYNHDEKLILNTSTLRLRFFGDLGCNKYLYYITKTGFFKKQIELQLSGQQPNFGYTHYSRVFIPIPPIEEQKRIVSILDKAFADIEQARAKTEQNLKNARELFESYLQQVFSQRGEGWETFRLESSCELVSGQHIEAKNYNSDNKGIGYLTGPSDFGKLNPIVTKWTEYPKRTSIKGDILITVKGSGVGKVNVMIEDELAISRQLMAVRPIEVLPEIVYWFLTMQYEYFQKLANGAAIPGISRGDVLTLNLSIPAESSSQELLIKRIEAFNNKTANLERIYASKLDSLEELKKSILQKAFSGELTNTENKGAAA